MLSRMSTGFRWIFAALVVAFLLPIAAFAQSTNTPVSFDAVDVHASNSSDQWVSLGIFPDGQVRGHNVTLRMLIAAAYNVDMDRVTGGPNWLDSEHFDLNAKTAPTYSRDTRLLMLRQLLDTRFKLAIHHDKKIVQDYALKVAPGGPKF